MDWSRDSPVPILDLLDGNESYVSQTEINPVHSIRELAQQLALLLGPESTFN